MLSHISWLNYALTIGGIAGSYYLYIAFTYYREELRSFLRRLTGKQGNMTAYAGDLVLPQDTITGHAQAEAVEFVTQEALSFGPSDDIDGKETDETTGNALPITVSSRLVGVFSDMISEVKTLIRVINESGESKETFEMLFRLVIIKYSDLSGTPYQQQINDFLITEGAPDFPFSLTLSDLEHYWTTAFKETAA